MSWKDDLFLVHTDHQDKEWERNNKKKKYDYGYNKDLDAVVISRDGTVGDIYEVQGLRIGLPKAPLQVPGMEVPEEEQVFLHTPKPQSLKKIKSIADFRNISNDKLKEQWAEYIEVEWNRREDGYWFMSEGEKTYITGSNYFFLNYHFIDTESNDTGRADFRHSNRIFFYFLEACRADHRCYGMCYLKNRRSGFSHMACLLYTSPSPRDS